MRVGKISTNNATIGAYTIATGMIIAHKINTTQNSLTEL